MSDAFRVEFTGERVIPGLVEANLFNEHLARYRFTARLIQDLRLSGTFLDAGCGTGYGTAELAKSGAQVLGIDVSMDAVEHARSNYGAVSNLQFEQASCTAVPAKMGSFRLITAFEVIEHLTDWRDFLAEARRVLDPAGLFLVSTPNRLYYAESREKVGPNPFHVHEFTEEEFRSELASIFPQVKMLLQNHVEGIAFSGAGAEGAALEIGDRKDDPSRAHFFLAICGMRPLPPIARFVFIPETGNVLQTRERHIALLEGEIQKKNQWIEQEKVARGRMNEKVRSLEGELEGHARWAQEANEEADRRAQVVAELQSELRKSNEWAQSRDAEAVAHGQRVAQLQEEVAQATAWATSLNTEVERHAARIVELQSELQEAQEGHLAALMHLQEEMASMRSGYEAAIDEWRREKAASDEWAMETERRLSAERDIARDQMLSSQAEADLLRTRLAAANGQLEMIAQSRWVRLGRKVRVGPEISRP